MPVASPKNKARPARTRKPAAVKIPGRIPDETFEKFHASLKKLTPAAFRRRLVEYGIIDQDGNRLYPQQ